MSLLHYLSSTLFNKTKKKRISDPSKIVGGASDEAEQNEVASFYHS
ncbi:hypothetical protein [Kordia jejudonensis]|nr:hypothetical protein [Kordia jejudonensis]